MFTCHLEIPCRLQFVCRRDPSLDSDFVFSWRPCCILQVAAKPGFSCVRYPGEPRGEVEVNGFAVAIVVGWPRSRIAALDGLARHSQLFSGTHFTTGITVSGSV